jgi:hypothetical protein
LRVRFVSADVAVDFSMLVFAMMTICFAVQQLGKKINPFVLAWHIQQWLAHAKPKKSTKSSGSSASPSERDRDDAASVHTAPGSGGKIKATASSKKASEQIASMQLTRADGSGLSPPGLKVFNWTAAALNFIAASDSAPGYNNLAVLACSPVHAPLAKQKLKENIDKFEKMWTSLQVDADKREAVKVAVIKSLIEQASARLTAIKKDADVLRAISELKTKRIDECQCYCERVDTWKNEKRPGAAISPCFSSPSLLLLFFVPTVPAKIKTPIDFADFSMKAMGDAASVALWQAKDNVAYGVDGSLGPSFRAALLVAPQTPIYSTKGMTDSKDKKVPSLLLQEVDTGTNRACPSFSAPIASSTRARS